MDSRTNAVVLNIFLVSRLNYPFSRLSHRLYGCTGVPKHIMHVGVATTFSGGL